VNTTKRLIREKKRGIGEEEEKGERETPKAKEVTRLSDEIC